MPADVIALKIPGRTFTPRWSDGERRPMLIALDDLERILNATKTKKFWEMEVTELTTGKIYKVKSAECSLPGCRCDATVEELGEVK